VCAIEVNAPPFLLIFQSRALREREQALPSVSAVASGLLAKTPYLAALARRPDHTIESGAAAAAPAPNPNSRNGDGGQRVGLIAGRSADRRLRVGAPLAKKKSLRRNKTLPDVQRLDLAYVSSAAGPAKPDGKLKRNWRSAAQPARAGRSDRGARRSAPPRTRARKISAIRVNAPKIDPISTLKIRHFEPWRERARATKLFRESLGGPRLDRVIGLKQHIRFDEQAVVSQFIANKIDFQGSSFARRMQQSWSTRLARRSRDRHFPAC
jgi:hypothetical protein